MVTCVDVYCVNDSRRESTVEMSEQHDLLSNCKQPRLNLYVCLHVYFCHFDYLDMCRSNALCSCASEKDLFFFKIKEKEESFMPREVMARTNKCRNVRFVWLLSS